MKWFANPKTLEELKKQYKRLALDNHPDRGGSTAAMQEINAEYDILFTQLKNVHETATGKTYTAQTENTETPQEFKDVVEKLVRIDGIKIEVCGTWIWVTGNTYNHRAQLKEIGFKWSKSKQAWYYHTGEYCKRSKRHMSLSEIREHYGSETVSTKTTLQLERG